MAAECEMAVQERVWRALSSLTLAVSLAKGEGQGWGQRQIAGAARNRAAGRRMEQALTRRGVGEAGGQSMLG